MEYRTIFYSFKDVTGDGSLTHGTFSEKPIGSEEFLNLIIEALSIIIDRHPKGRPCKMERYTI